MPSGYPAVTPEVKDQIINRIKENGERVPEIAKEFGLRPKSIYGWLASRNGGSCEIMKYLGAEPTRYQVDANLI